MMRLYTNQQESWDRTALERGRIFEYRLSTGDTCEMNGGSVTRGLRAVKKAATQWGRSPHSYHSLQKDSAVIGRRRYGK